jgi:hypothetical protein
MPRMIRIKLLDPSARGRVSDGRRFGGRISSRPFSAHEGILIAFCLTIEGKTTERTATNTTDRPNQRARSETMGLSWQPGQLGRNPSEELLVPRVAQRLHLRRALAALLAMRAGNQERGQNMIAHGTDRSLNIGKAGALAGSSNGAT